jgi:hypothetical protein
MRSAKCLRLEGVRCASLSDKKSAKNGLECSAETLPAFHIGPVSADERELISRGPVDNEAFAPSSKTRSLVVADYEIRIPSDGQPATVLQSYQISDFAAIRRGHALAKVDEAVEVWRGINCLYAARHRPGPTH